MNNLKTSDDDEYDHLFKIVLIGNLNKKKLKC